MKLDKTLTFLISKQKFMNLGKQIEQKKRQVEFAKKQELWEETQRRMQLKDSMEDSINDQTVDPTKEEEDQEMEVDDSYVVQDYEEDDEDMNDSYVVQEDEEDSDDIDL